MEPAGARVAQKISSEQGDGEQAAIRDLKNPGARLLMVREHGARIRGRG